MKKTKGILQERPVNANNMFIEHVTLNSTQQNINNVFEERKTSVWRKVFKTHVLHPFHQTKASKVSVEIAKI